MVDFWCASNSNEKYNSTLRRYIVTSEVSKHRVFMFVKSNYLVDGSCFAFGSEDAYTLGVLSSKIHVFWTLSNGGTLEDRPRYNNTVCFEPFPFPTPIEKQKQTIRELGERLDSHRKKVQAKYPDITITGMYNILEKIKNNQPLTDKDQDYNNRALVSTLKQIHDELDAAVFDAYGWSKDITDEEILANLVKLNAERAEEERNGLIRWLRPEYQAPKETTTQKVIQDIKIPETETIAPVEQQKWAKNFKEQLAAIRDLLRTQGGEWTEKQISAQFKGRKKTGAVANCLEILQGLGLIISHTESDVTRWYAAELQKTGE